MIRLRVITIQGVFLEETVNFFKFMGPLGEVGVLPRHSPLLTRVLAGTIIYQAYGVEEILYTLGGLVELFDNRATFLVDRCAHEKISPVKTVKKMDLSSPENTQKKKSFHELYTDLANNAFDIRVFKGAGDRL